MQNTTLAIQNGVSQLSYQACSHATNLIMQASVKRPEANKHCKIAKYVRITYSGIRFQSGVYDKDLTESVKPEKRRIYQIHLLH